MGERAGRWLGAAVAGGAAAGLSLVMAGGVDFRQLPAAVGSGLLGGWFAGLVAGALRRERAAHWLLAVPVGLGGLALMWTALGALELMNMTYGLRPSGRVGWPPLVPLAVLGGFWGWTWRLLTPGRRPVRAGLGVAALLAASVWLASPLLPSVRAFGTQLARAASCRANLRQLSLALAMYAADHDDRFPPPVSSLELAGVHYERFEAARKEPWSFGKSVLGDGLIWPYVKNAGLFYCPSGDAWRDFLGRPRTDFLPKPGLSYHWNVAVAGKRTDEIRNPNETPLLFDRRPIHRGRRNVAFAQGGVRPIAEREFESWAVTER